MPASRDGELALRADPDGELASRADPDGELASRAQLGDREAFERLVERLLPRVRAFLHRLSGSRGSPDDLAQETFLVAVRRLRDLREPERVASWIFGIALHVHRESARRTRRGAELADVPAAVGRTGAEADEERAIVNDAVARLADRLREAFLLRHVEGLSPAEASLALGVPEGTLRRWDFEARERLREILKGRGIGGPATRPATRIAP
ncbi:MAG TPA: RNA polymerase sigma factor [Planctomycetota bacterium]|nr:RNA polymerase sigma factor [Planctomycetota bacterium]